MKKTLLIIVAIAVLSIVSLAQDSSKTIRKAGELMGKGDVKGAFAVLDKAIADKKDLFDAYKMRSAFRQMFGDQTGALADMSAAIEIKADDGSLYEQRAMTRFALSHGSPQMSAQNSALILKDLDAAISFGRRIESVFSLRATIRQMAGDRDGAIADYQTAIGLRPDFAQSYMGLASLYRLNKEDDKALALLENFVNLYESSTAKKPQITVKSVVTNTTVQSPDANNQVLLSGGAFIIDDKRKGQSPGTLEDLRKAEDDFGQVTNTAGIYSNLAEIYLERKEYERASAAIEKALKIFRSDFNAFQTRGEIRTATGDYRGAVSDFDEALKIAPGFFSIYLARGIAYLFLNDESKAQRDFDKFLQVFPDAKKLLDEEIAGARKKIEENSVKPK